jgi:hypothetical protein
MSIIIILEGKLLGGNMSVQKLQSNIDLESSQIIIITHVFRAIFIL